MLERAIENARLLWANLPLRAKGLVVLSIPLTALLAATLAFGVVLRQAQQADVRVHHTFQVVDEIQTCLTAILNLEVAAHDHALSGQSEWLTILRKNEKELSASFLRLKKLLRYDRERLTRLERIHRLYRAESHAMPFWVHGGAQTGAAAPRCRPRMAEIEAEFKAMQAEAYRQMAERKARSQQTGRLMLAAVVTDIIAGHGAGVLAVLIVTAEFARRIRRLRKSAARLVRRLPVVAQQKSADEIGRLELALERASRALQREEEERERFFALSIDLLCVTGFDGYLKRINPAFSRVLGWSEAQLLERPILALVHPEDRAAAKAEMQKLAAGSPVDHFETRFLCADGSHKWLAWSGVPVAEEGLAYAIARDVTRHKNAEHKLRENEERFRTIFEQGPIGIALVDRGLRLIKFNRALRSMLGYEEAELAGRDLRSIIHGADLPKALEQLRGLFTCGLPQYRNERRLLKKNGEIIWVKVVTSMVRDEHQQPLYAVKTLENITERKKSEEQIVDALREKEILLREIHHRVKNNLQVISSLLNLQAGSVKDAAALERLRESQNRVRVMALVHEQLHRSADLSRIHFGEYLQSLAASLFCSYGIDSATIALRMEVGDVLLHLDAAIPCGLIVHELVANSLKHAFPGGRKGEILIGLQRMDGGRLRLVVADNGVGVPNSAEVRNARSLGLRLIGLLADQVEGELEWSANGGVRFELTFGP